MKPRATCPTCGGHTRTHGTSCSRCRRETSAVRLGAAAYVNKWSAGGLRRLARTFDFCGVGLTYSDIAELAGITMNAVQKRVSAGTPLFARRMRSTSASNKAA